MKYAKKWISIDDQVDLLTRGKGLGCNNVDDLKRSLETIGYTTGSLHIGSHTRPPRATARRSSAKALPSTR